MDQRKAGTQLVSFFLHDPLGEELLEGSMGGLLAGASQLGNDQPWQQTALQTATAIAGGIGMGILGRRLGAQIGRAVHKAPLKEQDSMVANVARMTGSETTASGLRDQGAVAKTAIQEALVKQTSADLLREAAASPAEFARKYNIPADVVQQYLPRVEAGRLGAAALQAYKDNPQVREQIARELSKYESVEKLVTGKAAGSMDELLTRIAQGADEVLQGMGPEEVAQVESLLKTRSPGDAVRSLMKPVQPITGEHVGRAVGRFIGDEVGILGGLAAGSLLAQQLGIDSPKDQKIRELEQQLKPTE